MYLPSTASFASTVPAFTVSPFRSHCMPCLIHIILTMGHTYEWKKRSWTFFNVYVCAQRIYFMSFSMYYSFFLTICLRLNKALTICQWQQSAQQQSQSQVFLRGGKIAVWLGTIKVLTYVYLITSKHHIWW